MDPDMLNELLVKVEYIEGAVRTLCAMVGATLAMLGILIVLRTRK